MKSRLLIFVLILSLGLGILAGCGQKENGNSANADQKPADTDQNDKGQGNENGDQGADGELEELNYDVLFVISKERVPDKPSLVDDLMKEKFNMVMDYQEVPQSSIEEKINLLFASKEQPDFMWPVGANATFAKNLGADGFLYPINEHFDKLPNYRNLFSDEEWQVMLDFESNADGNLYYMPGKNYRIAAAAWIYRESAFKEMDLSFPETVEDLYEVLKTIKANDPDSIPMPNRGGAGSVLGGLTLAHGVKDGPHLNPFTDEFVPYGEITDEYREALKWANTFYSEGLIDKEFATITSDQQWTERYATGKAYIEYSYAERDVWANQNMKEVDPDVNWEWSDQYITAYPEKGFTFSRETSHIASGPFFSKSMDEEKLDRVLSFFDWLSTDEGTLFVCMGEEGVTYEMEDGEPVFMDHMYHAERNPDGDPEWKYGLYLPVIAQHPAYIKEVGKDANLELSNSLADNSKANYFKDIPWQLTEEEEKQLADLETVVKDVRDEYRLKFIMGEEDPSDDKTWEDYINTLKGVGLEEVIKMRTEAYERIK